MICTPDQPRNAALYAVISLTGFRRGNVPYGAHAGLGGHERSALGSSSGSAAASDLAH
jgi:hypothetical protein